MSAEPQFRLAEPADAPELAARIREVSPEVTDILLKGLLPGIGPEQILAMVLRDASSHFSHRNCVLAELDGRPAGLLFAYPAELQAIPPLMARVVPASRLDPLRELLTLCEPGTLYVNTLLADALVDYARFWAEGEGMRGVSLFAWRDNARACAFYRRQGFRPLRELAAQGSLAKTHDKGDLYLLPLGESAS